MNGFYLGIDIGGTNVRIVSYDESQKCISDQKKEKFIKSNDPHQEVNENLCKLVDSVIKEKKLEHKKLKGIGISLAALFDRESGKIVNWPNNKVWNYFSLKRYLVERYNVPILLEDDANSAALGEFLNGAGKGYKNLAYITISTGVGCGLILNESLYLGSNGWAGEIGHIKVMDEGPECKCGMNGCFQSLVSGPALQKRFQELKMLRNLKQDEHLDLKDIVSLACKGDSEANEVLSQAGVHIGKMIGSLVMLLDIPLVVLGGGVLGAGDRLIDPLHDALSNYLKFFKREIIVKEAQLGDNSGAMGALGNVYSYLNNNKMITLNYDLSNEGDLNQSNPLIHNARELKDKNLVTIAIVNGPNINMLGIREPEFYGKETWGDIEQRLTKLGNQLHVNLVFFQSNHEGSIIDFIQNNLNKIDGIIINPAAYTKTGYGILDAITAINLPFVEVHISNIYERGGWHSHSIFSEKALGQITGFKGYVYELGLMAISEYFRKS